MDVLLKNFQSTQWIWKIHSSSRNHILKPFILKDIPFSENNQNKSKNFTKNFCNFTNGKYSILKKTRTFIQPARFVMDYAVLRRNILVNHNAIWELYWENITILPMILNLQNI